MHHLVRGWGKQLSCAGLALVVLAGACGKESDQNGQDVAASQGAPAPPAPPVATRPAATADAGQMSVGTQPATQAQAQLPRVDLQGLKDLVAEAKSHHQVLVMDFWATWCAPCVEMFPRIHQGVTELGPGVWVVSVTLDAPGKFEEHAIQYLGRQGALDGAYMLVPDTDARLKAVEGISTQWNDLVVPAILVFDANGQLKGQFIHNVDVGAVLSQVKTLLASSKVDPP